MCEPGEHDDEKEEIPRFEGQVVFNGNFDRSLEPTPLAERTEDE